MTSRFDKERVEHIQKMLEEHLEVLGDELNVQFTVGHASFTDTNCRIQLDVDVIRDGKVVSQEAEDWKIYAPAGGIDGIEVGHQFKHHELGMVEVVGWARRKRKFPVIVKHVGTRKRYKLTVASAILALAKPEKV